MTEEEYEARIRISYKDFWSSKFTQLGRSDDPRIPFINPSRLSAADFEDFKDALLADDPQAVEVYRHILLHKLLK